MQLIRRVYHRLLRWLYLIQKYFASFSRKAIIYTKKHAIYTSVFEEGAFPKYTFVYIKIDANHQLNWLEKILLKRSILIHADFPAFPNDITNKFFIAECEGKPEMFLFTDPRIKKILTESISPAKEFLGKNDKIALSYPAIKSNPLIERSADKPVTILCVGHGSSLKGYDVVYRLYKTLSQVANIRLIIAGNFGHNFELYPEITRAGYERMHFDEIYRDLSADKNVTIRPFKRDELLQTVYKEADIYLHLSRMETFGYSILEAMSFGLPVVSCNFKAISEMVSHNENGYLVYSNGYNEQVRDYEVNINSELWADNCYNEALGYVTALVNDPQLRKRMGDQSLKIIEEKFNLNNKVIFLDNLYTQILMAK